MLGYFITVYNTNNCNDYVSYFNSYDSWLASIQVHYFHLKKAHREVKYSTVILKMKASEQMLCRYPGAGLGRLRFGLYHKMSVMVYLKLGCKFNITTVLYSVFSMTSGLNVWDNFVEYYSSQWQFLGIEIITIFSILWEILSTMEFEDCCVGCRNFDKLVT